MWRASMPAKSDITLLRRARERFDLVPLAIHVNYLINLASLDPVIREKSIAAFRGEIERADAIGAEYLVTHPGSYKGQAVDHALAAFVLGMAEAASGLAKPKVKVLLENTAGSGAHVGCRLEELRTIRELAARETDLDIGYCLDTCHLLAAGFDVSTETGLKKTVEEADRILGLENVGVIHANDSKGPLGSHIDRHENIGKGHIGAEGFRRILTHPKLRTKAFILETPYDEEGDDRRKRGNAEGTGSAEKSADANREAGQQAGSFQKIGVLKDFFRLRPIAPDFDLTGFGIHNPNNFCAGA